MTVTESSKTDLRHRAAFARHLALEAGAYCLKERTKLAPSEIGDKGVTDPVSRIDRETETMIRQAIAMEFADEAFVGEEYGGVVGRDFWVTDPLDGTANFLAGLPLWGVCIAWIEGGEPVVGAIHLPELNMTLSGGREIGVDGLPDAADTPSAVNVYGVGRTRKWPEVERQIREAQIDAAGGHVISLGASSVSLAYVLAGKLSGYIEHHTNLWDCAPAIAMGRELGLSTLFTSCDDSFGVNVEIVWKA